MNKLLLIFLILVVCAFGSCKNKSKEVYFSSTEEVAEKTSFVDKQSNDDRFDKTSVKLSVLTNFSSENLSSDALGLLQTKMLDILTKQNIGVIGADPCYALVATVNKTNESLTSTVPTRHSLTYTINMYVGNTITGEVYGSYSTEVTGIGPSKEKASVSAIRSLKDNTSFNKMISDASKDIIESYHTDSIGFFNRVKHLDDMGKYKLAIALLNSVPYETDGVYRKAQEMLPEISLKYQDEIGRHALASMKAITSAPDTYNADIVAYYEMIPSGSKYKSEAEAVLSQYVATLNENVQEQIRHERFKEQEQLAIEKLQVRLNVEANEELMELYRNQALQPQYVPERQSESPDFFSALISKALPIGVDKILNFFF